MKCQNCGAELEADAVFCTNCGEEILGEIVPDEVKPAAEKDSVKKETPKKKRVKKELTAAEKKAKRLLVLKIAGAVVILIVIAIVAVNIALSVKAAKGRKLFDKVPLGRDIAIVESDTEVKFNGKDSSAFGVLDYITDYDYICESEDSVEVGGLLVPEWAVALRTASDGSVNEAVLYNFNAINHNWMGEKTATEIDVSVIKFGEKIKSAERALGLKPYTIIKESASNTSVYVYRYHFTDSETGNTIVNNLYITVDDVEGEVTLAENKQVDYMKLILLAE